MFLTEYCAKYQVNRKGAPPQPKDRQREILAAARRLALKRARLSPTGSVALGRDAQRCRAFARSLCSALYVSHRFSTVFSTPPRPSRGAVLWMKPQEEILWLDNRKKVCYYVVGATDETVGAKAH